MGSLLGDWPSFDPHNFSQLRAAGSAQPITKLAPDTYRPTHNKTLPPPNQVIANESKNILIAKLYQKSAEKLRPKTKRTASDNLTPEPNNKQPRGSTSNAES